jgi:hypothetical protein
MYNILDTIYVNFVFLSIATDKFFVFLVSVQTFIWLPANSGLRRTIPFMEAAVLPCEVPYCRIIRCRCGTALSFVSTGILKLNVFFAPTPHHAYTQWSRRRAACNGKKPRLTAKQHAEDLIPVNLVWFCIGILALRRCFMLYRLLRSELAHRCSPQTRRKTGTQSYRV